MAELANLAVLRGGLVVMLVGEGTMKDEQKQSPHCQQTCHPASIVPTTFRDHNLSLAHEATKCQAGSSRPRPLDRPAIMPALAP